MDAPNSEYRVIKQQEVTRLDEQGNVAQGVDIGVVDNVTGTPFTIFLPWDRYSAEGARMVILAKLGHIREVHQLSD